MKTRMVSFSQDMVRAMLAGRKDVTRRPVGPLPKERGTWEPCTMGGKGVYTGTREPVPEFGCIGNDTTGTVIACPLGLPGDVIIVRERARVIASNEDAAFGKLVRLCYEADGAESMWIPWPARLRPVSVDKCIPNGVFLEGARLRREIVSTRVERAQDITEEEVRREGFGCVTKDGTMYKYGIAGLDGLPGDDGQPWVEWNKDPKAAFQNFWTMMYGLSWARNDWVWRVEMKEVAS